MTDTLDSALSTIESSLHSLHRDALLQSLAPGLDHEQVRRTLGEAGLTSCAELESLYGWHDGTVHDDSLTLGDIWMFPIAYFLPLAEATLTYRALRPSPRWQDGWLPIFADGGGDFYVIDLTAQGAGCILHFRNEFSETAVEFDSLTAMMTTIATAFQRRVFFVDPQFGDLTERPGDFDRLAAELNPTVQWWNDPALA